MSLFTKQSGSEERMKAYESQRQDVAVKRATRELERQLAEANAEIARHHRDFEAIREILDRVGAHAPNSRPAAALRRIRNIVG
jgi:molecular chaperone GrpE (heat shock protein)